VVTGIQELYSPQNGKVHNKYKTLQREEKKTTRHFEEGDRISPLEDYRQLL